MAAMQAMAGFDVQQSQTLRQFFEQSMNQSQVDARAVTNIDLQALKLEIDAQGSEINSILEHANGISSDMAQTLATHNALRRVCVITFL